MSARFMLGAVLKVRKLREDIAKAEAAERQAASYRAASEHARREAELAGRPAPGTAESSIWLASRAGLMGMAALSTLLGVGAELGSSDDESRIVQALRTGASGAFNQVGQQAVGRGLDLAPTLTIRPGAPVRVLVTRDLVLQPYHP